MPNPTDMPTYSAPIGKAEERRLRLRARNRIRKLTGNLITYDADTLLALHEALDKFYFDTIDERADDEPTPTPPRRAVTG